MIYEYNAEYNNTFMKCYEAGNKILWLNSYKAFAVEYVYCIVCKCDNINFGLVSFQYGFTSN